MTAGSGGDEDCADGGEVVCFEEGGETAGAGGTVVDEVDEEGGFEGVADGWRGGRGGEREPRGEPSCLRHVRPVEGDHVCCVDDYAEGVLVGTV